MNTTLPTLEEIQAERDARRRAVENAYAAANTEVGASKRRLSRAIENCSLAPTENNFGLLKLAEGQLYEALAEQSEQTIKYFALKGGC